MNKQTYREFWIIKAENHHTGLEWFNAFTSKQKWIRCEPKPQIHVIEKSALDKANARIDKLRQALEFYVDLKAEYLQSGGLFNPELMQLKGDKLELLFDTAKTALKEDEGI